MLPEEYINASERERQLWIDTLPIEVGMQYFGGKSGPLGRKLLKAVCDMQAYCITKGERKKIYVDAFCGGGKMGLSVPEGWFDEIYMNDLDYGVYSYYHVCKDRPDELKKIVEAYINPKTLIQKVKITSDLEKSQGWLLFEALKWGRHSDEGMFGANYNYKGAVNINSEIIDNSEALKTNSVIEKVFSDIKNITIPEPELRAAFATVFITEYGFTSETGKHASYTIEGKRETEKVGLINQKKKDILNKIDNVNRIMNKKNITITRDDYAQLLDTPNDKIKAKMDKNGRKDLLYLADNKDNILFFLDPPYHPLTLSGQKEAGYDCTFNREMSLQILDKLRKLKDEEKKMAFIFCNYNPSDFKAANEELFNDEEKNKEAIKGLDLTGNQNCITIMQNLFPHDNKATFTARMKGKLSYEDFTPFHNLGIAEPYYLGAFQRLDSSTSKGNEIIWIQPNYCK